MRALLILSLTVFAALTGAAQAVLLGSASRDPNGLRRSVVFVESSTGELCSGAVIGPDLVLTAAHCVIERTAYRVVGVSRSFKPRRLNVVAMALHPTFIAGTTPRTQPGVDLALLKLARPLGRDFAPLEPIRSDLIAVGDGVTIAGFGVLSERLRRSARTLRQANLVSLGPVEVANRVQIVADGDRLAETAGAGACRGDSGGPILAATTAGYRLYGIVSWSSGALHSNPPSACGGLTAVTPVADHYSWITEAVRSLNGMNGVWTSR
jgi:secreted trypsin-like serine protease